MLDRKYELLKAFPEELEDDVIKALSIITQTSKLDFSHSFEVNFFGNILNIPERIYYHEPSLSLFNSLTTRQ